ncbi:MAG TPA: hypothetical protein VGS57_13715 [Thermoanaerobaculia bacterium]|jgi:pimeloyl-ACP methyl ester carboxylesterase|nr:hypothetical protein [Thermoanaerobaculia bacterium]
MTARYRHAQRSPRRSRRRWFAGLALSAAAVGVPLLLRRRRAAPPLPPHGWGRGLRYAWRGRDVHFQQMGAREGTPVVLVHSLGPGHDGAEWHRAAELLSQCCELLAPDLPGWGRSASCCLRAEPTAELYVGFLRDFLADVVRRPAILVGAGRSASFVVAAAAEAQMPGEASGSAGRAIPPVRALALVSPFGLGDADEGSEVGSASTPLLARLARVPFLATLLLPLVTSRSAINRHLKNELLAAPERADAAQRERHFRSARQPGAERALLAWLAGDLSLDVAELLPRLMMPVWLGWGRQSIAPPVETADLWLRLLPKKEPGGDSVRPAQLEIFEGSGPLPHLEAPVDFVRRLDSFIAEAA